jgi:uncharacterized protein (TIGR00251 family)
VSEFYSYADSKLILRLHLHTGCNIDAIGEPYGDRLRVRVKAQAIKGRANKHLIELLASEFAVKKSSIAILSGLHNRDKTLSIEVTDKQPLCLGPASQ